MKKTQMKPLILIGCLIAATCAALAYSSPKTASSSGTPPKTIQSQSGILSLSAHLTQDKVISGGDGTLGMALSVSADDVLKDGKEARRHVDMVIVLDRSGSMQGQKIQDARQAVAELLNQLSPQDRFALVSYSSGVHRHSDLMDMTPANRSWMLSQVSGIAASGGTNLGGGLEEGIAVMVKAQKKGNLGRLVLISDGLANEGITDPAALGRMAAISVEKEFAVSTVGVGNDFNEYLMTSLADQGTGRYYYLETPESFANVFQKEYRDTASAVATALEVRIPLTSGVSLTDAAGYPIQIQDNSAVFYPGDLLSGQTRKLFLTFNVPTGSEKTFEIKGISIRYLNQGEPSAVTLTEAFQIACVTDKAEAFASIRKEAWEKKVVEDEYNRLKQDVAADIKNGKEQDALGRIHLYRTRQEAVNEVVQSPSVQQNLTQDLGELEAVVKDSFTGSQEETAGKQKKNSKVLQYEGYEGRRAK
jgi:Ca-activated chloride channel family protein